MAADLRYGHSGPDNENENKNDNENENENDIKMHALDWLNEHGRILRGAFQPIECVLSASLSLSFSLSLQCDLALIR